MRDEMTATLNIYKWLSQAFWRYFELQALKQIEYERPDGERDGHPAGPSTRLADCGSGGGER